MRIVFLVVLCASFAVAQSHPVPKSAPNHSNADQLGMSCPEILQMSSTDWVAHFNAAKGADATMTVRGINAYGKCYDARTDQLAAALAKSGKGPLMGARGNFEAIEKALKAFSAKALLGSQPPADAVKSAYATLYEKQFRYEFYQEYAPKPISSAPTDSNATALANPSAKPAPPPATSLTGSNGAASDPTAVADAKRQAQKASDADPVTQAKNHFGELLGDLPDQQMHDLHGSFGEILGPNDASPRTQLLVYRYAIFLLEAPGDKPFSPPPF